MKKYINSKVYNTDTATLVGEWSNGSRDFNWCEELLYRKKTGEYFMHGKGGPMSRYAEQIEQNSWGNSEALTPLSYENARKWAEEHLTTDEYDAEFGAPAEDDTTTVLTISLPADVVATARQDAAKREIVLSQYIAQLIKTANGSPAK